MLVAYLFNEIIYFRRFMMNKTYLKKLEYYQILEQISNYCHTYIGKEKVLNRL